jgi:hypothetical protein
MPPIAAWDAADGAARAAARAISPTVNAAGRYALEAAYESTALVDTHHQVALDAVTGCVLRAHALASGDTREDRVMQFTRRAIRAWRDLAGLDNARRVDQAAVDNAVRLIAVPA